jgi:hypoxanthine phosphoribosyltransferase
MVQIHDKQFEVYIDSNEVQACVKDMAVSLNESYKGKSPLLIVVLNGSFMFTSDLVKHLTFDHELSFVKLSSYNDFSSLGNVLELIGLNIDVEGREVIIIEDIVDTGLTVSTLVEKLKVKKASTIKICSFLFKEEAFKGEYKPDFYGFKIPNLFVVGYGMDYNQKGRNLQSIYRLKN